jgi:rod shape-determining protein MreD
MRILLRSVLVLAVTIVLLVVEVTVLPHLSLPAAVPDLVLLAVLAFASAWGTAGGAVCGFAAGLVLDLAPPSVTAIGRHALVLAVAGGLAGHAAREIKRSALRTSVLAGLYAFAATGLNALLGVALGEGAGLSRPGLVTAMAATALYTAIATPLVVPGVAALARWAAGPRADVLAPVGNAVREPVGTSPAATSPGLIPETERA